MFDPGIIGGVKFPHFSNRLVHYLCKVGESPPCCMNEIDLRATPGEQFTAAVTPTT